MEMALHTSRADKDMSRAPALGQLRYCTAAPKAIIQVYDTAQQLRKRSRSCVAPIGLGAAWKIKHSSLQYPTPGSLPAVMLDQSMSQTGIDLILTWPSNHRNESYSFSTCSCHIRPTSAELFRRCNVRESLLLRSLL